jgi:hypothetical protein
MAGVVPPAAALQSLAWDRPTAQSQADYPTLKVDRSNLEEMDSQEIAANLLPNRQFGLTADGTRIAPNNGVWEQLAGTFVLPSTWHLCERDQKPLEAQ